MNYTEIRMFFRRLRKTLGQMWNCRYYMKREYASDHPLIREFPVGKKVKYWHRRNLPATAVVTGYSYDYDVPILEVDIKTPAPYNKMNKWYIGEDSLITE